MKRLCAKCHVLGGCWDAPRLVHADAITVGPCEWCRKTDVLVHCLGYDFRALADSWSAS